MVIFATSELIQYMSHSTQSIDEAAVCRMLRNRRGNVQVWQIMLKVIREPFIQHFASRGIDREQCRQVLQKAFTILLMEVAKERIKIPLQRSLFQYLLHIAGQIFEDAGNKAGTDRQGDTKYLAADVLVEWLNADVAEQCLGVVYETYKEPAKAVFRQNEAPEAYNEAMQVMWTKIRAGKVTTPMQAMLFTYFCRIFRHKLFTGKGKNQQNTDLESVEPFLVEPETDEHYLGYVVDNYRILQRYQFHNQVELVNRILEKLGNPCDDYFALRELEGWSHKEIAEHLGKTEGTARKGYFDCLEKARKLLQVNAS